jgi:2-polyprenyl-3-methyl-5-hydroxy-6-metoxy-1,4-benzoquinol methylase
MENPRRKSDRTRELDEKTWWDLWNTSYRAEEKDGEIASELFASAAAIVNERTQSGSSRVLEIACGTGSLSRILSYSTYHGLDISPASIALARQRSEHIQRTAGSSQPTYEVADFHDWRLPAHLYDVAVCVDAISCFRDQQLVLTKIAQTLQPSGALVLTTINPFVFGRIQPTQTTPLEEGPVSHWLSRSELHALLRSAGFTVERSYTIIPMGNSGFLRLINAGRVNRAFGPRSAAAFRRLKERLGLGQFRIVLARKAAAI